MKKSNPFYLYSFCLLPLALLFFQPTTLSAASMEERHTPEQMRLYESLLKTMRQAPVKSFQAPRTGQQGQGSETWSGSQGCKPRQVSRSPFVSSWESRVKGPFPEVRRLTGEVSPVLAALPRK